jgi:hypothetical protein
MIAAMILRWLEISLMFLGQLLCYLYAQLAITEQGFKEDGIDENKCRCYPSLAPMI